MTTTDPADRHCPLCGSERLEGPFPYASFEHSVRVRSTGGHEARVGPGEAMVCLECGHLALLLTREDLERVRNVVKHG